MADDSHVYEFLGDLEQQHKDAGSARPRKKNRLINFFAGFDQDRITHGGRGGYDAGRIDRFTEEFNPGTVGPNRVHQMHGQLMRERAWDLYRNNPFARSAVNSVLDNVVECGIVPKPRYSTRDKRKAWQQSWDRWGGVSVDATREADASGHDTVYGLQHQELLNVVVGGGCLRHYRELPRRGRSLPLAIELIDESRFAEDVTQSGSNSKTANPVIRGVEVEPSTGRAVAYHVRRTTANDLQFDFDRAPLRIPAERADYLFFREQGGQQRGLTLLKTAILWLHALGYYTDAELKASDLKSSWAYMVKTGDTNNLTWPDLSDTDPETGTLDQWGNTIEKVEPGMIWRGLPEDEIQPVGPNVPESDSLPWIRLIQMSIAIGVGLSYQEVMRDYSLANFHSTRMANNRDKKSFRKLQDFMRHRSVNPTIRRFTEQWVRAGHEGAPAPTRFQGQREEWLDIAVQAPGWETANPKEDAQADDTSLSNGSNNLQRIDERKGEDWEDNLEQQAREEQKRREIEEANGWEVGVTLPRPHIMDRQIEHPVGDGDDDVMTGTAEDNQAGANNGAVRP